MKEHVATLDIKFSDGSPIKVVELGRGTRERCKRIINTVQHTRVGTVPAKEFDALMEG